MAPGLTGKVSRPIAVQFGDMATIRVTTRTNSFAVRSCAIRQMLRKAGENARPADRSGGPAFRFPRLIFDATARKRREACGEPIRRRRQACPGDDGAEGIVQYDNRCQHAPRADICGPAIPISIPQSTPALPLRPHRPARSGNPAASPSTKSAKMRGLRSAYRRTRAQVGRHRDRPARIPMRVP